MIRNRVHGNTQNWNIKELPYRVFRDREEDKVRGGEGARGGDANVAKKQGTIFFFFIFFKKDIVQAIFFVLPPGVWTSS